jgi:uncharacterized protein YqcC (DUF446 family)
VQYWSKKNTLKPHQVALNSHKKFIFDCSECPHDFPASCNDINGNGNWCPYCSNSKLCGNIECNSCLEKSFASHEKAQHWSKKNTLKPPQVTLNSNKKFIFDCLECPHDFPASCDSINGKGSWCPYCANQQRCENIACNFCLKNSFASHEKVQYWSKKNTLKPHQVALNSHKKFIFDCSECPHDFPTSCGNINNGKWCPYCANRKLCGNIECNSCLEKSFASHEKAQYWSKKNTLKPHQVALNSNKKFIFDCMECLCEYTARCLSINSGRWCGCLKKKTETKLKMWLLNQPCIKNVKHLWRPKWCSTEYMCMKKGQSKIGRHQYEYDFLVTLPNKKQFIIELNGRQHYEDVKFFKSKVLDVQIRDEYKERRARERGIPTICIRQEDVWVDKNNWEEHLNKQLVKFI